MVGRDPARGRKDVHGAMSLTGVIVIVKEAERRLMAKFATVRELLSIGPFFSRTPDAPSFACEEPAPDLIRGGLGRMARCASAARCPDGRCASASPSIPLRKRRGKLYRLRKNLRLKKSGGLRHKTAFFWVPATSAGTAETPQHFVRRFTGTGQCVGVLFADEFE